MKSITVYCGSSAGNRAIFREEAIALARAMVKRKIDLVYGGAKVGIMGIIADTVLREGGKVTGVLPRFLQVKEIAHEGLTELILVDSMHDRKTKMNELCDGALALPGGFGTLDELFEMMTWAQLGLHKKPVGILNVDGFYDDLDRLLAKMTANAFLKSQNRDMLLIDENVEIILDKMENYSAPDTGKWLKPETT